LRARRGEFAALRDSQAAIDSQMILWAHHVATADALWALRTSDVASDQDVEQTDRTRT